MQLPIDIKELMGEATNIAAARETALSVSLYVDESAPADVVAHVRGAFASTLPTVRMALSYLDDSFAPRAADDIAVVVAGPSKRIGAASAAIRAAGTPAMVVTTLPEAVARNAEAAGYAIPEGDLVAPLRADADEAGTAGASGAAAAGEGAIALDDDAAASLDTRMGAWIVSVCREKRLAFAMAFPFMRRSLAKDAVLATSIQNAGIGLVPLLPGADLPIMTLNQAKMVLQIAAAYGHDMDKGRLKELAAVVGGAYACRTLARELAEFVPLLGFVAKPAIAYGGTSAIGYAVMEYFEGGESVTGVANAASKLARSGGKIAQRLRAKADELAPTLARKYGEYAPKVADVVDGLVAKSVAVG